VTTTIDNITDVIGDNGALPGGVVFTGESIGAIAD